MPDPIVTVVQVIDGDSVIVQHGNAQRNIRLHGIDAPESSQPHGPAATEYLKSAIPTGAQLIYRAVKPRDKHGRSVGTLRHVDSDQTLNYLMVLDGHAYAYPQHGGLHPSIVAAEQYARQQRLGIWRESPNGAERPWDYRRRTQPRLNINPKWLVAASLTAIALLALLHITS